MKGSLLMKAMGGSELLGLGKVSASVKSEVGWRGIRMAEVFTLTGRFCNVSIDGRDVYVKPVQRKNSKRRICGKAIAIWTSTATGAELSRAADRFSSKAIE